MQDRLQVRTRRRRSRHRVPVVPPKAAQQRWSIHFVRDLLTDGLVFRVLTVVDQWSRQIPLLEVVKRVTGADRAQRSTGCATRSGDTAP